MGTAARSELGERLHRLANHVECSLAELLQQLLVESNTTAVQSICYRGCDLIEALREARDAEGGEV